MGINHAETHNLVQCNLRKNSENNQGQAVFAYSGLLTKRTAQRKKRQRGAMRPFVDINLTSKALTLQQFFQP